MDFGPEPQDPAPLTLSRSQSAGDAPFVKDESPEVPLKDLAPSTEYVRPLVPALADYVPPPPSSVPVSASRGKFPHSARGRGSSGRGKPRSSASMSARNAAANAMQEQQARHLELLLRQMPPAVKLRAPPENAGAAAVNRFHHPDDPPCVCQDEQHSASRIAGVQRAQQMVDAWLQQNARGEYPWGDWATFCMSYIDPFRDCLARLLRYTDPIVAQAGLARPLPRWTASPRCRVSGLLGFFTGIGVTEACPDDRQYLRTNPPPAPAAAIQLWHAMQAATTRKSLPLHLDFRPQIPLPSHALSVVHPSTPSGFTVWEDKGTQHVVFVGDPIFGRPIYPVASQRVPVRAAAPPQPPQQGLQPAFPYAAPGATMNELPMPGPPGGVGPLYGAANVAPPMQDAQQHIVPPAQFKVLRGPPPVVPALAPQPFLAPQHPPSANRFPTDLHGRLLHPVGAHGQPVQYAPPNIEPVMYRGDAANQQVYGFEAPEPEGGLAHRRGKPVVPVQTGPVIEIPSDGSDQ